MSTGRLPHLGAGRCAGDGCIDSLGDSQIRRLIGRDNPRAFRRIDESPNRRGRLDRAYRRLDGRFVTSHLRRLVGRISQFPYLSPFPVFLICPFTSTRPLPVSLLPF